LGGEVMPFPPLRPDEDALWLLPAGKSATNLFNSLDPVIGSPTKPDERNVTRKDITIAKSLLVLDSVDSNPNSVTMAVKQTTLLTDSNYYSFGTTLFFKPSNQSATKESSGGISFFTDSTGKQGYVINIKTSGLAGSQSSDEFQILKTRYNEDTNKTTLSRIGDSQTVTKTSKVTNILQGSAYKLDINVKVEATKTTITAFINGYVVVAIDTNVPLPKTNNIGLFCSLGTIGFDYVYARSITELEYNSSLVQEIYKNQFAQMSSNFLYGDLWLSGINQIQKTAPNIWIEEFGPVAREIKYIDKDYSSTPAAAKYISRNVNNFIDLIGFNLSPFNVKAYIINNSGTFVPMDQASSGKISVIGNQIINSSGLVYMDESLNKYDTQEPITFDSKWIQKESDAQELSKWIKTQWKNHQIALTLDVIANPKIEVGDIISVNYSYHELTGTEKFIVNSISQTWNGGIKTVIQARSIYAG